MLKLVILSAIALSGIFCLIGVPGFEVREGYERPDNLSWEGMWRGSEKAKDVNSFVTGMYNVIW
jgi:hypothetical protein